jgi:molybdenum storage protein
MGLKRDDSGRLHIETDLMAESLMDKGLLAQTDSQEVFRALPGLQVVKLGGQSVIDRGAAVLKPILQEVVEARPEHKLLLMTGGGTRSRHAYAIAMDLGMPTGVLAELGAGISQQNALMVSILLAPYGGVQIDHGDLVKLPGYLALGAIPVMEAMPPYGLWEKPPQVGRIPAHRTDVGTLLTAEVMGAQRVILVKDERGLFTADPKKNPDADFIEEISAGALMERDLDDLAVERTLLEALANARSVEEVLIVNGRERGALTQALNGENSGTRITRS